MAAQDQRPRFYESQYLGADDMNAVVEYGHAQLAHHELGAHTAGIAVGLTLIESRTAGPPQRVNVTLAPGMAIDGFGRQVVALRRELLSEALLARVPYDAGVDDPALTNGTPRGRFVPVWIEYDEDNAKAPAPGFERCDAGDEHARVRERFRFVVGEKPVPADRRSPLSIGGQAVAAERALQAFDMTAGLLRDESVPHQQFPADNARVRWLIPIGFVRWVAFPQGGGYFVDRNIEPGDRGDARNRKVRRYIGVPTEAIHAVDGALVLRNRTDPPDEPGRFQARLQSGDPLADTTRDLVWVEGNLRAVGDIRLARGALRFTDINGSDGPAPLSIERAGDGSAGAGGRAMRAVIGPDQQPDNRLAISTITVSNPDPALRQFSEKLTVLSGGNVGVGTAAPKVRVHVTGDRIRLESLDRGRRIDLRADGAAVDLESTTSDLYLRSGSGSPPRNIVMNPGPTDGNVGIGTAAPADKLHVAGPFLQVAGAAGEQAVVGGEGHNGVVVGTRNAAVRFLDARNLAVGFGGTNAAAWLGVWCRDVHEVSDEHAKSHVRDISGALAKVAQLRGVSFRWKGAATPGQTASRLGLIAQEVQQVVPEAVTVNERGAGLSTSALVPLLVEAIKELKSENEEIRAELARVAGRDPGPDAPRKKK